MSDNGKKKSSSVTTSAPVPGAQPVEAPQPAAAGGWFSCNVNMTGPAENGDIYVHLREVNGQFDRWYVANAAAKKEMLATALTAISASLKVSAYLASTNAYGRLDRLYVVR